MLDDQGPEGFSKWLKEEKKIYYTDTTFRDAHQSLTGNKGADHRYVESGVLFCAAFPPNFQYGSMGRCHFRCLYAVFI